MVSDVMLGSTWTSLNCADRNKTELNGPRSCVTHVASSGIQIPLYWVQMWDANCLFTVVMDVPEIIGLYNVKPILTDNSI